MISLHTGAFLGASALFIIGQAMGIIGMLLTFLSYIQKQQKWLILTQCIGAAFWAVHFLLLGIDAGMLKIGFLLNTINIFRNFVYAYKDKFHTDHIAWAIGFIVLFVSMYPLSFLVFHVEPTTTNFIVQTLPILGTCCATISFRCKSAKGVRILGLVLVSPPWLVYDFINFSIGGTVSEALNIISMLIGIIKYDIKRDKKIPGNNIENN